MTVRTPEAIARLAADLHRVLARVPIELSLAAHSPRRLAALQKRARSAVEHERQATNVVQRIDAQDRGPYRQEQTP